MIVVFLFWYGVGVRGGGELLNFIFGGLMWYWFGCVFFSCCLSLGFDGGGRELSKGEERELFIYVLVVWRLVSSSVGSWFEFWFSVM